MEEFFNGHKKKDNPGKILLEGGSGTGKTFLSQRIAYKWSQGEGSFIKRKFRLVFFIELRRMKGSIANAILEQCLPQSYGGAPEDISALLDTHSPDCLFVLDGYEDLRTESNDVWELIEKKLYPKSGVILTTNSDLFNVSYRKYFDTKLTMHGLPPDSQEDLIRKYAEISGNSVETYAGLLAKVVNEYDTTVRVLSLNPLYCMCMSLINETFGNLDFNTVSFMLQNFMHAVQKFHCRQKKIVMNEEIIPDDVKLMMNALSMSAYKTILNNDVVFLKEKLQGLSEYQSADGLIQFGLLDGYVHHPATTNTRGKEHLFFHNKVIQEFLAAKHLSLMEPEDCINKKDVLTSEPHLYKVAVFYCGIHRFDYNLRSMREMFELISQNNREHWKIRHVKVEGK